MKEVQVRLGAAYAMSGKRAEALAKLQLVAPDQKHILARPARGRGAVRAHVRNRAMPGLYRQGLT